MITLTANQSARVQKLIDTMQAHIDLLRALQTNGYTPEIHHEIEQEVTGGYEAAYAPVQDSHLPAILEEMRDAYARAQAEADADADACEN